MAIKLFDRISRAFGVNLPIAALFQAPTIAGLGQLLRKEGWAPSWSSLVPIQTAGTRRPLFCVHAIGGNVLNYRLLSKHLGDQQPFYGIQARGLGGNEPPHATVEEMAAAYIQEMRQEQPHGPYQLCGASSGGVAAFEMAQQLHAAGERVSALVMLDTYRPGPLPGRVAQALAASPLHRYGMLLDIHIGNLLLRTPREGLTYLTGRLRTRFGGGVNGAAAEAIEAATPAVREVAAANKRALRAYVPRPYAGSVVMLFSRDEPDRAFSDQRLAWADLLEDGLLLRFIPGSHENMLDEPQVAGVAAAIARCLDG
jgi:thioesterase domain-containing protein